MPDAKAPAKPSASGPEDDEPSGIIPGEEKEPDHPIIESSNLVVIDPADDVSVTKSKHKHFLSVRANTIKIGGIYDVLDSSNRWCEGEVVKMDRIKERVYISYVYWDSRFDEWIDDLPNRLMPVHTHTYKENGILKNGQRIDVLDETLKWLESFIVDENEDQVRFRSNFHLN
jgi:hypothetical protein